MTTPTPETPAGGLTAKEIELRDWLREQPGGSEKWMVIKAGFRRSYDLGAAAVVQGRAEDRTRIEAAHRHEWADYFERWTGAVGPEPLTVEHVLAALRAERLPFGHVAVALTATEDGAQ